MTVSAVLLLHPIAKSAAKANAKVDAKELEETYLPAFRALVKDADVEGVMGAYNRVNGDPACANPPLMEKLNE